MIRQKLRMIISHASGGHLSEPKDIDRSVNDICVEISRHHNLIWAQAQKSARDPDELREALVQAREALHLMMNTWLDYHDAHSLTKPVTGASSNAFDKALEARDAIEAALSRNVGDGG